MKIKDYLQILSKEIFTQARKTYRRRKVVVKEPDELWQMDLAFYYQGYPEYNDGYSYIFNVIDVFSKYCWAVPIKDKKATTLYDAFSKILDSTNRRPKKIQVDKGSEFYNKKMNDLLKRLDIKMFSSNSELKAQVVERFNRTQRHMLMREMTKHNTLRWVDFGEKVMNEYNNKIHSSIGMTPIKASNPANKAIVFKNLYGTTINRVEKPIYKLGQAVRISFEKKLFSKESTWEGLWSEEIFFIREVHVGETTYYKIRDIMGEDIDGLFYKENLLPTQLTEPVIINQYLGSKNVQGVRFHKYNFRAFPKKYVKWFSDAEIDEYNKQIIELKNM